MSENGQTTPPDINGPESNPASGATAEGDASTRVSALEAEKRELNDRMLRIAADFENWKKRARKDLADAEVKAREGVLRDTLEVIDNLERALSSINEATSVAAVQQGVSLVLRTIQQKLERHDVRAIDAKGKPFDPRLHEAIARVATAEVAAGSVANERQRGYMIGDRLLRPALVEVAVAPESGGGN